MNSNNAHTDVCLSSNKSKSENVLFDMMGGNVGGNDRKQIRWSTRRIKKVKRAIQANPESLVMTDAYHRTPLLIGLLSNAPASVLIAAIEANPDALLVKDRAVFGNTFLHEAMSREGVDSSIVLAAIRARPDALGVLGSGGYTPILTAIESMIGKKNANMTSTVVVEAVRAFPEALKIAGCDGMTPLHHIMKGNAMDHYPWHRNFAKRLNEIARAIVEVYPHALAIQDRKGQTPLHCGMSRNSVMDGEVLEAAIRKRPDIISAKTFAKQSTVLHTAIEHGAPDCIIIAAVNASPETLELFNCYNKNPLRAAVSSGASEAVLMAMLNANPKALNQRDGSNNQENVLISAVESGAPVSFLMSVIEICPELVLCEPKCYLRYTLIHKMIIYKTHLSVVEKAIKIHPSALLAKNFHGQTPLFFAAFRTTQRDRDLFKLLLRYCPQALNIPNNDDVTPINAVSSDLVKQSLSRAIEETKPLTMNMVPNIDCSKRRFCDFFFCVVVKSVNQAMVCRGLTRNGIPDALWWNMLSMLCEDDLPSMSRLSYLRIMLKSKSALS